MPQNNPPILLENPPASMPEQGSKDYELLLEETGGASANEGFNYEAHIAATRQQSDPTPTPAPTPDTDLPRESGLLPRETPEKDPNGNLIAPIYLENPPSTMPVKGTDEYALLAKEIGNTDGKISEGFNYKAHIAATRQPKDYPDWIDPVADIDDRWVAKADREDAPDPGYVPSADEADALQLSLIHI